MLGFRHHAQGQILPTALFLNFDRLTGVEKNNEFFSVRGVELRHDQSMLLTELPNAILPLRSGETGQWAFMPVKIEHVDFDFKVHSREVLQKHVERWVETFVLALENADNVPVFESLGEQVTLSPEHLIATTGSGFGRYPMRMHPQQFTPPGQFPSGNYPLTQMVDAPSPETLLLQAGQAYLLDRIDQVLNNAKRNFYEYHSGNQLTSYLGAEPESDLHETHPSDIAPSKFGLELLLGDGVSLWARNTFRSDIRDPNKDECFWGTLFLQGETVLFGLRDHRNLGWLLPRCVSRADLQRRYTTAYEAAFPMLYKAAVLAGEVTGLDWAKLPAERMNEQ